MGKDTLSKGTLGTSPSSTGATLEKKCSLGEQILSYKGNPQIIGDTVSTIEIIIKINFRSRKRAWKTVKCTGKIERFEVHNN